MTHTARSAPVTVLVAVFCAFFALALGVRPACAQPPMPEPGTLYVNANIYTADPDRPRAEAMVVSADGRLLMVGSAAEAGEATPMQSRIVDLGGRTVLPGLIDAHGHMAGLGALQAGVVDLSGTATYEEVVELVVARAADAREGAWIIGRGWDHERWPANDAGRRPLPTHEMLSAALPDVPVVLSRVDGHAVLVNRAAMDAAGLTRDTPDPGGGEVIRDDRGEPTGVLIDLAENLVTAHVPPGQTGDFRDLVLAAQNRLLAEGITGVHDMGVSPGEVAVYQELEASGDLKIRINAAINAGQARAYFESTPPFDGDRLTVRSAKLYMDGAMGSRGAWLIRPYDDRPVTRDGEPYIGLALMEPDAVRSFASHALEHGYQLCTHAIGDRANRAVLQAYALAAGDERIADNTLRGARFRVEHAQLLHKDDISKFAALGVIASMQPRHATSDMRWVADRVGDERARGAYAWASLLRTGAVVASGSDFPVEPSAPMLGFYAAVTRQDPDGTPEGGWMPDERMTRAEALASFTRAAAYAGFRERHVGMLAPGMQADFIVLSRDIMTCDADDIPDTRVVRTVIGGETVYERNPW